MLFGPLPGIMFWRLLCKMCLRHRLSWDEKPEDMIQMELTAWSFVFVMCSCLHVLVVCLSTLLSALIIWRKKRRFGQFKVLILVSVWRDWEKVPESPELSASWQIFKPSRSLIKSGNLNTFSRRAWLLVLYFTRSWYSIEEVRLYVKSPFSETAALKTLSLRQNYNKKVCVLNDITIVTYDANLTQTYGEGNWWQV